MSESGGFDDRARAALDAMVGEVEALRKARLAEESQLYEAIVRASFAKAFDFAQSAFEDPPSSAPFFVIGTLRGTVEDLIVLGALRTVSEPLRSDLLVASMRFNLEDALLRQYNFFAADGRGQIVLGSDDASQRAVAKRDLKRAIEAAGLHPGTGTGNMFEWARSADLLPLYEFHYAAASRLVHFSPGVLLRTGWADDATPDTLWTFRVRNFEQYYLHYHRVWSCDLLVRFVLKLGDVLGSSADFEVHLAEIADAIQQQIRLPELVTFEEMNLKPPNMIVQALSRVMAESGAEPVEAERRMAAALEALEEAAADGATETPGSQETPEALEE